MKCFPDNLLLHVFRLKIQNTCLLFIAKRQIMNTLRSTENRDIGLVLGLMIFNAGSYLISVHSCQGSDEPEREKIFYGGAGHAPPKENDFEIVCGVFWCVFYNSYFSNQGV